MKSKLIPFLLFTAVMSLTLPGWAGPFTSKSQNAAPEDNTVVVETPKVAHHGNGKKCGTYAKAKCGAKATCAANAKSDASVQGDARGPGPNHRHMGREGMKQFMANMSDADRARFKSIHEKLSQNSDVRAARDAVKNAEGPDAKHAAFKKLHEARRAAMSEEDRAFMDGLMKKMKAKNEAGHCHSCSHG